MSNGKTLLLYTGPFYTPFTSTQCANLINNSGANEFLLLSAYPFNYCQANDPILVTSWVNNLNNVPDSVFGTTDPTSISTIRCQMAEAIQNYANNYSSTSCNLTLYVSSAVTLAEQLIAIDSNCKIWFGFPRILTNCYAAAIRYNYYYNVYVYSPIKTQMQANGHWGNVEGFYYGTEDIPRWYTRFDTNAPSTQYNNVIVSNMKYLSDIVHNDGKKMLWIPYYRPFDYATIEIRDGYVINRTNIFDKAILQPSYYFTPSLTTSNLDFIKNCVSAQACKFNDDGSVVGGAKTSSTEIGFEMEIDINVCSGSQTTQYLARYNSYVSTYKNFITGNNGTTKRPSAFYAGAPEELLNGTVFGKVSSFFNNGT